MTAITASASLSSISASASFANQTVTGGISPSGILYQRPVLTGQTTSYANYDDGWNLANNVYDYTRPANPATVAELDHDAAEPFITLKQNNAFGNKNRFTDDAGGQTYSNSYAIDHLTGLGWYYTIQFGGSNWTTQLSSANSSTLLTYTNWRMANLQELLTICNYQAQPRVFSYSPFSGITSAQMSSTTNPNSTSSVLYIDVSTHTVLSVAKIFTGGIVLVRNHY